MELTTADREWDPYEEQTRRAAAEAEQLRGELVRARIELEMLERNRRRQPAGPGSLATPLIGDASPFGTLGMGPEMRAAVGGWAEPADHPGTIDPVTLAIQPPVRSRAARFRWSRRGLATGVWFITFYLLLVALAQEGPEVPGSTPYQSPTSIGMGTADVSGI